MKESEIIEVLQGFQAGKAIEWRSTQSQEPWEDVMNPAWNFAAFEFRIKPVPLKPLHRCEPTLMVVRTENGAVCLAEVYSNGVGLIHQTPGPRLVTSEYDYRGKYQRLTRAECEAAGLEWPETAREP